MNNFLTLISHDAFRFGGGLNKSAGEIYWQLMKEPMSVKELVAVTGRSKTTVYRVLKAMSTIANNRTGEVLAMVFNQDGVWQANLDISLDQVALIIGTAGIGKRKREYYRNEQKEHRKALNAGRKR